MNPRTAKALRTRGALVRAGREVFARVDFLDATISEITTGAGLAHGTFYTYFDSKEQIFLAVVQQVYGEAFAVTSVRQDIGPASTPMERIALTNRRYLRLYAENARIMASFEALSATDPDISEFRREARGGFISRTSASIRRWQGEGLVAASIDADCVAHCLGSMVERVAHMQYVFGEGFDDEDRLVDGLTHVWLAALGLDEPDRSRPV